MNIRPSGRALVVIGLSLTLLCVYIFKIGHSLLDYPHGWVTVLLGCMLMVFAILAPVFYFYIIAAIQINKRPQK